MPVPALKSDQATEVGQECHTAEFGSFGVAWCRPIGSGQRQMGSHFEYFIAGLRGARVSKAGASSRQRRAATPRARQVRWPLRASRFWPANSVTSGGESACRGLGRILRGDEQKCARPQIANVVAGKGRAQLLPFAAPPLTRRPSSLGWMDQIKHRGGRLGRPSGHQCRAASR